MRKKILILLSLLAGLVILFFGLVSHSLVPLVDSFNIHNVRIFFTKVLLNTSYVALGALGLAGVSKLLKLNVYGGLGVALFFAGLLTDSLWPLMVTAYILLSSYLVGNLILCRYLRSDKDSFSISTLLGLGVYGYVAYLAAFAPINYSGIYSLVLAIPLILRRASLKCVYKDVITKLREKSTNKTLDLALCLLVFFYFSIALMPERGHDALVMHLFIPSQIAQNHLWGFDVTRYLWASTPMFGDIIFSIGYMLGGELSARLINFCFAILLAQLVGLHARWAGASETGIKWSSLIFLSTSVIFLENSSLYVDLVWSSFILAGSFILLQFLTKEGAENEGQLLICASFLGFALSCKAQTLLVLPPLAILFLISYKHWSPFCKISTILKASLLFFLIACPPYAASLILTGNPLFPYFNALFRSPLWVAENFKDTRWNMGVTFDFPYQMTFKSEKYLEGAPGSIGFAWVVLLPVAICIFIIEKNKRIGALLLISICSILLMFNSMAYLRYVIPALAWYVAVLGAIYPLIKNSLNSSISKVIPFGVYGLLVLLNIGFIYSATYYADFSYKPLLSKEDRDQYVRENIPMRYAAEVINKINNRNAPIAIFSSSPLVAGLKSDYVSSSWYSYSFSEKLKNIKTTAEMEQLLIDEDVDFLILDMNWDNPRIKKLVLDSSDEINLNKSISIRKLHFGRRYTNELLTNSSFDSLDAWNASDHYQQSKNKLVANNQYTAKQTIKIKGQSRYLNTITSVCPLEDTQGRNQINWLDANSKFLSTDIQLFNCNTKIYTSTFEVTAPKNAKYAEVYASGHANKPVTFLLISMKQ